MDHRHDSCAVSRRTLVTAAVAGAGAVDAPRAARGTPAPRLLCEDYKPIWASIGGHLSFQGAAAS